MDPWIGEVAEAFEAALTPWLESDSQTLSWDAMTPAIDAAEEALFWLAVYAHARGVVDVRERVGAPVPQQFRFEPVNAIRASLKAAGYSWDIWRGLAPKWGEFSSVLAMKLGHDSYSKIAQSLGDALGRGQAKAQWVRDIGAQNIGVFRDNPWYIENVFRTNTSTYYAAGKWHAVTEIPEVVEMVEFLEFIAIQDDRTTDVCEGMDGTIKPVSDPIWGTHYPPNHYQCRSTVEPISKFENEKPKDPKHLEDPGEGFNTNVGRDYSEKINDFKGNLRDSGLANEVARREENVKNEVISSKLWVDGP